MKSSLSTAALSPEKKEGTFSDCFLGKGAAVHRLFEIQHSKPCLLSQCPVSCLPVGEWDNRIKSLSPIFLTSNLAIRPLVTELVRVQRTFGGYGPYSYLWTGSQS